MNEINFKDYYSFEDFKLEKMLDEQIDSYQFTIVQSAFIDYLKAISKKGLLKLSVCKGHDTKMLQIFDSLIKDKLEGYQVIELKHFFFLNLFLGGGLKIKHYRTLEAIYEDLINYINLGNFEDCHFNSERCLNCDTTIKYAFENWNLSILEFQFIDFGKSTQEPVKQCLYEDKLYEAEVNFKSTEILIADWFRIEEFTKQVEYNKDYKDASINTDYGQIKQTLFSAENFNFITIGVGNTCPSIFKKNEELIIARYAFDGYEHTDEDSGYTYTPLLDDYVSLGSVCTDLWNVTIIDKQTLIDIVSNKVDYNQAVKIVDIYLESNDVTKITLPMGKYKVSFNPRHFVGHFDLNYTDNLETFFTLNKV